MATRRSVDTMKGQDGIAGRVAESIRSATGLTQAQVAEGIGLTGEELAESLSERRAFSTVELVQLAEVLNADAHWLITGQPDPHRLIFTARHDVDHDAPRPESLDISRDGARWSPSDQSAADVLAQAAVSPTVRRTRARKRAIDEVSGSLPGVYGPGYLEELRADWPE